MNKLTADPVIKFFISVIGTIIIFLALRELQHIFIPFVLAYFLYFLYEPLNKLLRKIKFPVVVNILINLIITSLVVWLISQLFLESFSRFGEEFPYYERKLNSIVRETSRSFGVTDPFWLNFDLPQILGEIDYGVLAGGFFSSTLSVFTTTFFVLFFFIFISVGHKKIYEVIKNRYIRNHIEESKRNMRSRLEHEEREGNVITDTELDNMRTERGVQYEKTFRDITANVQKYIITKTWLSLLVAFLVGFILWIFNVNFFFIWALVTFLFNFVPSIGSTIAVILPAIMTLIQFESFGYSILVAALMVMAQTFVGNILEPKVFGDKLGLNPLVILLALLLWGYVWGVVGMFLSVPLTAIAKIVMSRSNSEHLQFLSDLMSN